jgi:Ubiquitin-activating enzyme active site
MIKEEKVIVVPEEFEKDVDTNHHVDLLQAMTNCRAENYSLEDMEWMDVKIKAGRITPALVTTTAIVAGIQTLETMKVLF